MKNYSLLFQIPVFCVIMFIWSTSAFAQNNKLVIRIAKLQIDSLQLENYKLALKEEIEASVRIEPGVLALYAVADKLHPSFITIFEIYADEAAYNAHRETPHFKKYKSSTLNMVISLELLNTVPVALEAKKNLSLEE